MIRLCFVSPQVSAEKTQISGMTQMVMDWNQPETSSATGVVPAEGVRLGFSTGMSTCDVSMWPVTSPRLACCGPTQPQ